MFFNHFFYYTSAFALTCVCILANYLLKPNPQEILRLMFTLEHQETLSVESSLWCYPDTDGHKLCAFKNLYYAPLEEQFIFVLSNTSILLGIDTKLDLQKLELSSVLGHNRFIMKIAIVPQHHSILKRRVIRESSAFVMSRFKSDNILHVIHDDLLPLFVTYSNICVGNIVKCAAQYRLVFADSDVGTGPFREWYSIFSKSEPLALNNRDSKSIFCFNEARVGLLRSSVWFQYGYGTVQGPVNNTWLNKNIIKQFVNFIVHKFNIKPPMYNASSETYQSSVLFSRKVSRKMLNENVVAKSMLDVFSEVYPNSPRLKVFILDVSVNDTKMVLTSLLQSRFVVGMHGAELILSIFLPAGSVLIELFPFGIEPNYVSPMKSLSHIIGERFEYTLWVNTDANNTLTHPEAPALLGGIQHLPPEKQAEIISITQVPAVPCCHDPAYLFRMFQDTLVGPDFVPTLEQALRKQKHFSENIKSVQMYNLWFPSPVHNISCNFTSSTLTVRWNPSLNVEQTLASYEVTVTSADMQYDFVVMETQLTVNSVSPIVQGSSFNVWIKCVAHELDVESLDAHLECTAPQNPP